MVSGFFHKSIRQFICTFLSLNKTGTAINGAMRLFICGFAVCKALFILNEWREGEYA